METNENPTIVTDQKKPDEGKESFWELVRFALITVIIALGVRFYIAQPFIVSGASMVPTFEDKQYLIVDELSYHLGDPVRGDVVVFHPPKQPRCIDYVNRVIGLPNETITINNGIVTIKNTTHPEGFVLDEPYISEPATNTITRELGPDEYFVMGDNRPYSSDSRVWGVLPRENIVGRAFLRLLPLGDISVLPGVYRAYTN